MPDLPVSHSRDLACHSKLRLEWQADLCPHEREGSRTNESGGQRAGFGHTLSVCGPGT